MMQFQWTKRSTLIIIIFVCILTMKIHRKTKNRHPNVTKFPHSSIARHMKSNSLEYLLKPIFLFIQNDPISMDNCIKSVLSGNNGYF